MHSWGRRNWLTFGECKGSIMLICGFCLWFITSIQDNIASNDHLENSKQNPLQHTTEVIPSSAWLLNNNLLRFSTWVATQAFHVICLVVFLGFLRKVEKASSFEQDDLHMKGLTELWMCLCCLRPDEVAKVLPQSGQACALAPTCWERICRWRLLGSVNTCKKFTKWKWQNQI